MPLPPLWSLGYHQSRYSYFPEAMVRNLATSGCRVQVALAPAGAGKTAALRVLAGRYAVRGRDVTAFGVVSPRRLLWPLDDRGSPLTTERLTRSRLTDYADGLPLTAHR